MPGCAATSAAPATPIATNQTIITGPKTRPTAAVPQRWTAKRGHRMTSANGTTSADRAGAATSRPSTAESTEMAGVMTLSP